MLHLWPISNGLERNCHQPTNKTISSLSKIIYKDAVEFSRDSILSNVDLSMNFKVKSENFCRLIY